MNTANLHITLSTSCPKTKNLRKVNLSSLKSVIFHVTHARAIALQAIKWSLDTSISKNIIPANKIHSQPANSKQPHFKV